MTTYADIRKRFHRALSRALNTLRPQQSAVSERKPTRAPIAPAIDHGLLTVIVPTYDVAEYLGLALETVLAQSYSNMEILIVDDGSEDQTVTVAEAYAARDPRIRLLAQDHGGQGRARNLAIGSAQGTFITFLDADDELPNRAYEQLIESLIRSGSDFCIGAVERFTSARVWRPAWSREVHARTREFVTIDEFPTAMKDIMACNRMYRRSFWDAQVGTFGEGTAYEDHVPMLRSFFNDAHFDVLTNITYRWRTRDDGSNTGQQKGHLSNLTDRIEVKHQAWTALTNGSDVVKRAWLARVIDIDFGSYYVAARDADDTYRRHLADGVRYFWERLDPVSLSLVRPRSKLSAWLIAQGDWNGLERLVDSFGNDSGMNKQFLVDGAVGLSRERIAHVIGRQPDADLCLSTAFESRAFAQIRHLSWQDDRTLDIDGLLNLGFVDLADLAPSADLIWSSEGRDVHRVKLTFDPVLAVAQERTGTSRPAPVPFSASIPFATIPGLARGILDSRIDLHVAGLSTSTTVIKPAVSRSPKAQPSTSIDTADGQLLLTPRIGGSRFTIDARSRRPRFTIVSAVYNVARYLDDFIRSVEAQTFDLSQVEIIMVDDGSTDHSLEVLREWQTRRPELITVLTQENQGQGAARNAGLRVATGHWVTFPDPDDTLDHTYFQDIDTFIEQNPSCILVATNRILHFEESNSFKDTHPLRHHFARGDRLFDLDEFSDRFHGSAPCAVFLLDQVHAGQNEFDSRIRPNFEDGHFVTCYLLAAPSRLTGFLASAKYYYRKRADQSSTLQNSLSNAGRYTDVPEYGYLDVLRRAQGIYGHVPGWLQNYMLYELSWYFSAEDRGSGSETAAQGAVAERFHVLLKEIRSFIDDQAIRTYTSSRFLPLWRDALLHAYAKGPWHSSYLVRQEVDERQGLMRLTYRYVGDMPRELIIYRGKFIEPMYAKTQVHRFFDSPMVKERILVVSARGKVSIQLDGVTM